MKPSTDYNPGDAPVPVGAVVEYFGSGKHGRYDVTEHYDPASRRDRVIPADVLAEKYPDGTAYTIWPVGVPREFGLRHLAMFWVRRESFRVVSLPQKAE